VGLAVKDNRMATSSMRNHTLRLHGFRLGKWKVELPCPSLLRSGENLKLPRDSPSQVAPKKLKPLPPISARIQQN
jgi:hypothetical protein